MVELQGSLLTLFFLTADVSVSLLFIIPGVSLIVTLLAIARHIKAKKKPSRATVIFLAFGGGFLLTSLAMMLMDKFDLSPYLFGVGSSVLCPVSIGLSALCLIIGSLLLMKGMIRKFLVMILAVLLAFWLLFFGCFLCLSMNEYERADENTVIETEILWHNSTVTEYEIIFPGLMKKVDVTYQNNTA